MKSGQGRLGVKNPKYRKLYKITDRQNRTRAGHENQTQWFPGEWVVPEPNRYLVWHTGPGPSCCTDKVLHAYQTPYHAALFNNTGPDIHPARLWIAQGIVVDERVDKVGCSRLRVVRQMKMPRITTGQKREFLKYLVNKADRLALNVAYEKSELGYRFFSGSYAGSIVSVLTMLNGHRNITIPLSVWGRFFKTK